MDTTATATTADFGFRVQLETYDGPSEALLALAVRAFVAGELPAARRRVLHRVRAEAALVPPGLAPARTVVSGDHRAHQAEGPGWILVASVGADHSAWITVVALTDELAADVIEAACADAEEPVVEEEGEVEVCFWHLGGHGPRRVERAIAAPTWQEIRANYSEVAVGALDALAARREAPASGRLVLLHGPPGTGKTTVLRSLAREWASWCRVHHVIDPERMFASAGYLLDALATDEADERWKLLVLEDCDELIRGDAKAETGQALARLLNLTDGMIGQGVRALVAITTNERLGVLHPAVTRPGRCLAEVEVGPLLAEQARAWLGAPLPGGATEATLAQLHAWRSGEDVVGATEPAAVGGTYL